MPAHEDDVYEIVARGIRRQDRDELAALGRNVDTALMESFERSWPDVYTILADGDAVGMFGAAQLRAMGMQVAGKGFGVPWMLATEDWRRIARDFMQQSVRWVEHLNHKYTVLVNWVSERNTVSRAWLEHTGFEFDGRDEDIDGVKFLKFQRLNYYVPPIRIERVQREQASEG